MEVKAERTRGTDIFDVSMEREEEFFVKVCTICEQEECECKERALKTIEEATETIVKGMELLLTGMVEFSNREWKRGCNEWKGDV